METKKNSPLTGVKKAVSAIDTGIIHTICGLPVHVYYYKVKNKI